MINHAAAAHGLDYRIVVTEYKGHAARVVAAEAGRNTVDVCRFTPAAATARSTRLSAVPRGMRTRRWRAIPAARETTSLKCSRAGSVF